jgi:hypothetical protein
MANIHAAYKAYILTMAKVSDPFAMTVVLSMTGLVAIIINSCLIIRYGRRRVALMGGFILCGLLQLIVAVVYDKNPGTTVTGQVLVALSCLYLMSYNVSTIFEITSTMKLTVTVGHDCYLCMAFRR